MKNSRKLMKAMMAGILSLIVSVVMISCNEEEAMDASTLGDAQLIEAIQSASNKEVVSAEALPTSSRGVLEQEYSESYTEEAMIAPKLGYEVALRRFKGSDPGEQAKAYFGLDGRALRADVSGDRPGKMGKRPGMKREHGKDLKECFDFVFPVTVVFSDGTKVDAANEQALKEGIKAWYSNNKGSKERPTFEFPLTVKLEDGTTSTVNSMEELKTIGATCITEKGGRHEEKRPCFKFVLPVTFNMADGTTITVNTKEDFGLIKAWHEANPDIKEKATPQFPVELTFEDGTTKTINSKEEMQEVANSCGRDRHEDRKPCFKFVLPVTFNMADGTTITVNTKEDFGLIKAWHEANPDIKEKATPQFPVELTFEDGTTKTINSKEEMEAVKQYCHEGGNG